MREHVFNLTFVHVRSARLYTKYCSANIVTKIHRDITPADTEHQPPSTLSIAW